MSSKSSFKLRQVTSSLRSSVEVLESAPSWATKTDAPLSVMLEWLEGNRGNESLGSFLIPIATNHRYASASSKLDIRWSFVGGWLLLLDSLSECLHELASYSGSSSEVDIGPISAGAKNKPPQPPPDLLSLRDLACIHSVLEVVVLWGIFPCLEPGVGQSAPEARQISKAIRLHRRVRLWGLEVARAEGVSSVSAALQLDAVLSCLKSTLFIPQLEALFLPKYLPDILCGYLQLSHGYNRGEGDKGVELHEGALDTWGAWLYASSLRQLLEVDGSPTWLKVDVGRQLTGCLLRPGGLESVLCAFLAGVGDEGGPSSCQSKPSVTSGADKLGSLLASKPESVSWDVYTTRVFPQLHELLIQAASTASKGLPSSLLRTAFCMIDKLSISSPRELSELVIIPSLSSLLITQEKLVQSKSGESEIETSVKCLELLVCDFHPSPSFSHVLLDVEALPCALLLFSQCHMASNRLLGVSRRIAISLLDRCPLEILADQVYLALSATAAPQHGGTCHRAFSSGPNGGVIVVNMEAGDDEDDDDATVIATNTALLERFGSLGRILASSSTYVRTAIFAQSLGELFDSGELAEDSPLPGTLFCSLLQRHLRFRCISSSCEEQDETAAANGKACKNSESDEIMIGIVIMSFAEILGPKIFSSGTHILECFSHLLSAAAEEVSSKLKYSEAGGFAGDDFELGICCDGGLCEVCLGLLTAMIEMGEEKRTEEDEQLLRGILIPLEILSSSCGTPCIAEMSTTLRASIMTRDLSLVERLREKDRSSASAQLYDEPLSFGEGEKAMLFALEEAKEDIRSEAAPMRARGIVTLIRLVRRAGMNKVETNVANQFIETFIGMLSDDDSYVYLAAIQGLATLSDKLPSHVIPRLVAKLCRNLSTVVDYSEKDQLQQLSWPQRHKLAEAMMYSARRCGDAIPKYAGDFIGAFVRGAATRPPHNGSAEEVEAWQYFRAGCLSNLAEVCGLLRWSLPRYATDVMNVSLGVLEMESDSSWFPAVGRGAVYLLVGIIRGCSTDLLFILPDYLKSIRHSLQLVHQWGGDPVAKYLAEQGLSELDDIVRSHLTP